MGTANSTAANALARIEAALNHEGLPPDLLAAVASPGGGKIALVLGAGCSVEAPTGVPVSSVCSVEVHRRLVADGVLRDGDCADPADLSLVADAVFEKTHSQRAVVERLLEQYDFKLATPNNGYLIAAALLCEGVISSVVTLNFDLALSNALSQLGGKTVGVVESPAELQRQKTINVYYLHRNANAADPEQWILRSNALKEEWRGNWEQIIATSVLKSPVIVFAGLGSPIGVLIESVKLLRQALPRATTLYMADPGESATSKLFTEFGLDAAAYIKLGWSQFMDELSERLSVEQVAQLGTAVAQKLREDRMQDEDISDMLDGLRSLGIVNLGLLRGHWLLNEKPYCPVELHSLGLIADLLLALATVSRLSGANAVIMPNGRVEFQREGRVVASFLVASGRGHRAKAAIEADVASRRARERGYTPGLQGVLVGGTSDAWTTLPTPPRDIVNGDGLNGNLLNGTNQLPLIHIADLRANPDRIRQVVP